MEAQYYLNDYARAMLGLEPQFVEPVDDDIPSDPDANKSDTEDDDEELPLLED